MTTTKSGAPVAVHTERDARIALAAVYRLIAHFGMADLIFTHVSVRVPGHHDRFLINPYGLLFDEVTASDLVVVGLDGTTVEAGTWPVNPAGFVIHSAVHAARSDATCVVHTHTRAGCAVAAQRDGLLPVNQMSMEFYGDVGYHDYEGIALDLDERRRLVDDLADHSVLILRNHGLLSVGTSPAQAFLRMLYLHRSCEIQIAAQAGGAPLQLPPQHVVDHTAAQFRGGDANGLDAEGDLVLAWAALTRLLQRTNPGYDR